MCERKVNRPCDRNFSNEGGIDDDVRQSSGPSRAMEAHGWQKSRLARKTERHNNSRRCARRRERERESVLEAPVSRRETTAEVPVASHCHKHNGTETNLYTRNGSHGDPP